MRKKYNMGGALGALESLSPLADTALPGLGSALSLATSFIQGKAMEKKANESVVNNLTEKTINTNPYGFALGGVLKDNNFSYYKKRQYSSGGILVGKEDLSVYHGSKHSNGGIAVNSKGLPSKSGTNEVEGEEAKLTIRDKEYIFSSKLIIE